MKRVLIIAGLVFLAAALVFLNRGLKNSAMPDKDEDEQAQQAKAAPAQKTAPSAPADPKAVLPPEETVGDPVTAKHHIEAGWVYDEGNQQKPETLTVAIQKIHYYVEKSGGTVSAEIVDLDVPVEDRTPAAQAVTDLGVRVDGQPVIAGNLSDAPISDDRVLNILESPVRKP